MNETQASTNDAPTTATPSALVQTATAAANASEKAAKAKKAKSDKPKAKKAKAAKPAKKAKKAKAKDGDLPEGPAVLRRYAPEYVRGGKDGKTKTAAGNKTIDCDDDLAAKLRGKDLPEVYEMAVKVLNKALEEGEKEHTVGTLKAKYKHLNVGMQRMNLGNRMRAILYPKG